VVLVLVAGVVAGWYALHPATASAFADHTHLASAKGGASDTGFRVLSISPSAPKGVNPNAEVVVRFSASLPAHPVMPTLVPPTPGLWSKVGPSTLRFSPAAPYMPLTAVKLTVPAGHDGTVAKDGATLRSSVSRTWVIENGSALRMQQLLAQLGYLPMRWTPGSASSAAITPLAELYQPPAGSFSWTYAHTPALLKAQFRPGTFDRMTVGAMVAFERTHQMVAYTSVRAIIWPALLSAAQSGSDNPEGYTYAIVSKGTPETLTLWHDGSDVFSSLANTGVAGARTPNGTFFVYLRRAFQYMAGTNPNGTSYDVPVSWINYFDGSDAIHGYPRATYGFPQSNGCVELPVPSADVAYHDWIHYGTLVTITA
jgi:hypothetical protein